MKIELNRVDEGFNMEARDEEGHVVLMDSATESGGHSHGVRPMQMLIMGLGGCSAIDILTILKKQKQDVNSFRIRIEAEREQDKEPALWEQVFIRFELSGSIDMGKAVRAAELSMQKYCSVAETLRRAGAELFWEVRLNED